MSRRISDKIFKSKSRLYGPQGSIILKDTGCSDENVADMAMSYKGITKVAGDGRNIVSLILNVRKNKVQQLK